jgi:restriction endonuclease S subunit
MIQRNSKTAGLVSLSTQNTQESTNIYFLNNINNNIDNKFLYYILKNKEQELNILANYTMTTNLPRNKLEDFEINILNNEYQKIIVKECDEYESNINMLLETNKKLSLKNMIEEVNL